MTEYGRGPGSEPWHPEDPLYGDAGYSGQRAPTDQYRYDQQHPEQYPHQAQQQYYPQQGPQHPQQSGPYGQPGPYDQSGAYEQWGTGQQSIPGQYQPGAGPQQVPGQQAHPQMPGQGYGGPQSGPPGPRQPGPGQPGLGGYPGQIQDPGYGGQYQHPEQSGWNTGQHGQVPYGAGSADPYGQQPRGHHPEEPDPYPGPGGYPPGVPQQPPVGQRPPGPGPGRRPGPGPEADPDTGWDPGPDQGENAFFAGDGDDGDGDDDDMDPSGRGGRRERRGRGPGTDRKRRNGCACLGAAVVLVGVVSGVGYFGYQLYEDHFGPPPDFSGAGTAQSVTVEIPKGSGGYAMGQLLKKNGVVKSVDAFVQAQQDNPKGQTIQDGVYTLKKQMSAESAVSLMLEPKSRNSLIIAEGRRNAWVYDQIDKHLDLKQGTTASVAKKDWKKLGLPSWALNHGNLKDPLEGFLYPSSYPVAKGMKPEDVLKRMVAAATQKYQAEDLQAQAKRLHLDGPWQVITVASLVQAEGKTHDDFRKMAEVVYNRLDPGNTQTNQLLQFDSTFNYLKGQSNINISESEINSNHDPYNTYTQKGLTPGPIGNPGAEALAATLNPTHDGWIYFVATDGMNKTEFAKTYSDFQKLKEKFNDSGSN